MRKKWEDEMRAAVLENERQMKEMKQTYEERLQKQREAAPVVSSEVSTFKSLTKLEDEKLYNPHISNLNFDEQLSGKIVFLIRLGSNTVGKSEDCDIHLTGPKIQEHQATIFRKENSTVIMETADEESRVLLNGDPVKTKVILNHNDR